MHQKPKNPKGLDLTTGKRERQEQMWAMHQDGDSYQEIADHFGFKVSTVETYVSAMRRRRDSALGAIPGMKGCPYCSRVVPRPCAPKYAYPSIKALTKEDNVYDEATLLMLDGSVVMAGPCTFPIHEDGKQAQYGVCVVNGREVTAFDQALYGTRCWHHELSAEFKQVRDADI